MFILLIEDDQFYSYMLKELLSQNGYTDLKHYDNGLECLQQVYEDRVPDVIFMDYQLGLVNGVEVLQKIKAYRPDLRVIFLSGQNDVRVAVQAIKKGAREYIVKDEKAFDRILAVLKDIEGELSNQVKKKPVNKFFSGIKDFLVNND